MVGWVGLAATIVLYGLLVYLGSPKIWRFVIFIPATTAAIGFLQAYTQFCAYFGMRGVFNVDMDSLSKVEVAEFRAKDQKKAWKIIAYSVIIGLAATVIAQL